MITLNDWIVEQIDNPYRVVIHPVDHHVDRDGEDDYDNRVGGTIAIVWTGSNPWQAFDAWEQLAERYWLSCCFPDHRITVQYLRECSDGGRSWNEFQMSWEHGPLGVQLDMVHAASGSHLESFVTCWCNENNLGGAK